MNKHLSINPALLKAYAYLNGGSHFKTSQLRCKLKTATTDEGYDCKGYHVWFYGMSDDEAWYIKQTGHPSESVPFDVIYIKDLVIDGTEDSVIIKLIEDNVKRHLRQANDLAKYISVLCTDAGL